MRTGREMDLPRILAVVDEELLPRRLGLGTSYSRLGLGTS
jgi:hypothetical protein